MQMASVHVGTDTDYAFSSRKDEQTLLRSTRIHGVKAADRGFLAATIDTDPAGAKAQSY